MPGKRFCLDTNVFFYAIDPQDRPRHHRAIELIERAALEHDCVVPLQVFAEFFASATRKGRMGLEEAAQQISDWKLLFPTAYPGSGNLEQAIALVQQHQVSFWDAMIWAVALSAGATVLLTEDFQDGRDLDGIEIRNPFAARDPFR